MALLTWIDRAGTNVQAGRLRSQRTAGLLRTAWLSVHATAAARAADPTGMRIAWDAWAAEDEHRPAQALWAYLGESGRFPTLLIEVFTLVDSTAAVQEAAAT
jgi:hypothetical protein